MGVEPLQMNHQSDAAVKEMPTGAAKQQLTQPEPEKWAARAAPAADYKSQGSVSTSVQSHQASAACHRKHATVRIPVDGECLKVD